MKYDYCDCNVNVFDNVLYVYPQGDCDRAVVYNYDPTNERVKVVINDGFYGRVAIVHVTTLSHMDCNDD